MTQHWKEEADRVHRLILSREPKKWDAYSDEDLVFLAMSMGGEAGEVLNDVKKWMRGDYTRTELRERVSKEIADVQILLFLLARTLTLSLDVEAELKMVEVAKRWETPADLSQLLADARKRVQPLIDESRKSEDIGDLPSMVLRSSEADDAEPQDDEETTCNTTVGVPARCGNKITDGQVCARHLPLGHPLRRLP